MMLSMGATKMVDRFSLCPWSTRISHLISSSSEAFFSIYPQYALLTMKNRLVTLRVARVWHDIHIFACSAGDDVLPLVCM